VSEKTAKKPPEKATEKEPARAPTVPMRGVIAVTDGTIIQIQEQNCSMLELRLIGDALINRSRQAEQEAVAAMQQAAKPEEVKEPKGK